MQRQRTESSNNRCRRGLAPLELVLSLPMLLFVMALMVNLSVVAAWKVRGLTTSRQAIWRDRMFWNAGGDPHSPNWPTGAAMRTSGTDPPYLDSRTVNDWELNPKIVHDFMNGPTVNGNGGMIEILTRRSLYMAEGLRQGESELTRNLPMLPNLRGYENGYHMEPEHPLLDNRWQFGNIRLRDNRSRRLLDWYNFDNRPDWMGQKGQYQAADGAIQSYPNQGGLTILDRDPELWAYYGGDPINFYPLVTTCGLVHVYNINTGNLEFMASRCSACEIDPVRVHDTWINPPPTNPPTLRRRDGLVDRIQGKWPEEFDTNGDGRIDVRIPGTPGVAYRVAQRFASMYAQQKAALEAMMPPPQAQIDDLQDRIDQLNDFMRTVPH
jgi:hypothetical protein